MPSLGGATEWLNAEPPSPAELRGQVVFAVCPAWAEKYKHQGLMVSSMHKSEFAFEQNADNVRSPGSRSLQITVPKERQMNQDTTEWKAFTRSTTMTMIVRSYGSRAQALAAARTLEAMGIDGGKLRVLQGAPERDGHTAPTGHFGGPADGPVGTWVNADGRTIREGSFADGDGHRHDALQERAGSFADVDHDTITSLPHGLSQVATADHPRLIGLLTQAQLEQAAVEHAMAALHHGAALLLAEVPHDQAATVQALLDQSA
jgi:hypothetical protein